MPNDVLDLAKRIESARKLKQNWFFLGQTGSWRLHPHLLTTHLFKPVAQYDVGCPQLAVLCGVSEAEQGPDPAPLAVAPHRDG